MIPLLLYTISQISLALFSYSHRSWIENLLLDPDSLAEGLKTQQRFSEQANARLDTQIDIIDEQIKANKTKPNRLVDLAIDGDFPRDRIASRRKKIETALTELQKEKHSLLSELQTETISDEKILELEEFVDVSGKAFK
jgi:hypothetical protein